MEVDLIIKKILHSVLQNRSSSRKCQEAEQLLFEVAEDYFLSFIPEDYHLAAENRNLQSNNSHEH